MTEDELIAEIAIIRTAISHIAQTGERYVIGTGPSRREFEASIPHLRDYLTSLQRDLADVQLESGVMVGF